MSSATFSSSYEQTLSDIEQAVEALIDESDVDLDYETVNNILTLTCPDGSSIIITPQSATGQLWLAARSGGFHFDLKEGEWVCDSDGETLKEKLSAIGLQQAGVAISL